MVRPESQLADLIIRLASILHHSTDAISSETAQSRVPRTVQAEGSKEEAHETAAQAPEQIPSDLASFEMMGFSSDNSSDLPDFVDVESLSKAKFFKVREAKDQLSQILNRASSGEWSIIEAGQGGSVLVVSADQLLRSFEKHHEPTMGDAMQMLPFRLDGLPKPKLRGRPPRRGLLRNALSDVRSSTKFGLR